MAELTLASERGGLPAYAATPTGAGPWPGVVVLHDVLGLTNDLRRQADWLASEGFLAIAPDLFAGRRRLVCTIRAMREVTRGEGQVWDDVETARRWLLDRDDCTGRIGTIGFCFGGGFALLLAPRGEFAAASVNYGPVPDDAETTLARACPIVASYGAKDRAFQGHAARLEQILDMHGVPHDVQEYAEAGHGFMSNHDPAEVPLVMKIMSVVIGGIGYHQPSELDARRRIAAFFRTHLEPEAGDG
jgi:carboxymethylenebutenolidase